MVLALGATLEPHHVPFLDILEVEATFLALVFSCKGMACS